MGKIFHINKIKPNRMTVMKKEKKMLVYTKCLNNMQMCFKSVIAFSDNKHKTILYNIAPLP